MKRQKQQPAEEIGLIPFEQFAKNVKRALAEEKAKSDAEITSFQAANVKKREASKKKNGEVG